MAWRSATQYQNFSSVAWARSLIFGLPLGFFLFLPLGVFALQLGVAETSGVNLSQPVQERLATLLGIVIIIPREDWAERPISRGTIHDGEGDGRVWGIVTLQNMDAHSFTPSQKVEHRLADQDPEVCLGIDRHRVWDALGLDTLPLLDKLFLGRLWV